MPGATERGATWDHKSPSEFFTRERHTTDPRASTLLMGSIYCKHGSTSQLLAKELAQCPGHGPEALPTSLDSDPLAPSGRH